MKRILPFLICLVMIIGIIGLTCVPVEAVSYEETINGYRIVNWYDVVSDVVVDGDIQSVTLCIPADWYYLSFRNTLQDNVYYSGLPIDVSGNYGSSSGRICGNPFGVVTPESSVIHSLYYISTESLPDNLEIEFEINLSLDSGNDVSLGSPRSSLFFQPLSGSAVTDISANSGLFEWVDDQYYRYLCVTQAYDLSSYDAFAFRYVITFNPSSTTSVYLTSSTVYLHFDLSEFMTSISDREETAAFRSEITSQLQQQGYTLDDIKALQQQTNEKLDGIQDSMDDANDKLNDILSGSSDQQAAADDFASVGDDQTGRLDDAVSDLQNIARPNVDDIDISISTLLGDFGIDGFNEILALIWENELIYQLLVMSSLVMLASYILYGKKV